MPWSGGHEKKLDGQGRPQESGDGTEGGQRERQERHASERGLTLGLNCDLYIIPKGEKKGQVSAQGQSCGMELGAIQVCPSLYP